MEIGNFGFSGSGGGGGGLPPIVGGGTLNYIAKYTPNGTTINNSLLFDNGTSVGLGTITPDASAILELSSTTQGFATPRMTTLQRNAIVAPTIGLLIYNTSSSFFNYWDGSTWIQMDTSTGGDVSGSGTTNYATMWTDGANSVIGDGTWAFSGNDYYPVTTGSNIGDATHRIGTIFMASVFDYANNLTFFNGTSTTMTLTTGGQLGIGTTPNAMLDVLASGSGTVGLNLNTSSTQDAKLHFRTNNAATARSQIYLADATQTLNVYTVNNDTIFWNGNGLAQVKTLTLFTNNTAKFENFVYVGSNITFDGLDTTNYPISIRSSRGDLTRVQNLNTGNTQTDIQIGNNNGANSIYYGVNVLGNSFIDNRTGNLLFQNTGATQMTFDNTGRLGIGITPTYMLDVFSSITTVFRAHGNAISNNSVFSSSNQSVSLTLDTAVSSVLGSVGSSLILNTLGSTKASLVTNSSTSNVTLKSDNGYWLSLVNSTTESIGLGQGGNFMQFNMNGVNNMILVGSTGNFGIGVNTNPLSKLYVSGIDATTKATLRLEPITNVTEDIGGNTLNTTTNATVALETIAIPTDTVVMVESYITCRKTGGAGVGTVGQGNGYIRTVKAKNVGGVVTIGVVQSSFTSEDIAVLNTTFAVSGTNIVLNVTGATNNNITWNSITKKYKVS
jgi:hypothetical protein